MKDHVIGIDLGGTKIATGILNRDGNVLHRQVTRCHAGENPEIVIDAIVENVNLLFSHSNFSLEAIRGIGVGSTGHIHSEKGIVLTSSNLPGWDNHPLKKVLEQRLGAKVILDNDANCAAWAEFKYGAGRGSRHMCYITFSTGCGMGIVIDGKLYQGATGTAGEIGHVLVNPDGPLCTCGKKGCLMSYACGLALSRMAEEYLESDKPTLLRDLVNADDCRIAGEDIAKAAQLGDQAAIEMIMTAGRYFGYGLSTIIQVLNPDCIVIGGGLVNIGPILLDPCMEAMNQNIHPVLVGSAKIALSELWNDAGMIGAGALVWEQMG